MPCEADAISADACLSQIGMLDNDIKLLQVTAQNMANWLLALDPAADVSPDAISQRACESGIGWEQSDVNLLRLISQNLCSMVT